MLTSLSSSKCAVCAFFILLVLFAGAVAQESATRDRRIANNTGAQATVMVNEQFLNSFLAGIFDNLNEPSMPLTVGGARSTAECASEIKLKREVGSVRTAVHFENGRVTGPLAFAGAYNSSLLGCVEFTGWADAEVNLESSRERRALVARFKVRDIHLNNTPELLNGPLLTMVQNAIDRRYNPVDVVTLEQLSTRVNIQPAGGALRLEATDLRPEITPEGLALHISYRFVKG
jgi:hypothetical protein